MNTSVTRENILLLARRACDTLMAKFDAPDLPPVGQFHYHQGVFLDGLRRGLPDLAADRRAEVF